MSNVSIAKSVDLSSLLKDYQDKGGKITVGRSQKALPKNLRYNSSTVNGKNHAPS